VHESGRHLLGLINDLLDLSKIEAGRLEVVLRPCSLRSLADEAVMTLRPMAEQRQLEVTLDAPESLAAVADAARYKQVLYNLLSNAIKFTPPGGSITLSVKPSPDRAMLRTEVRDTGPGISAEDQERLFTPFTQLANAKGRGGTGLGLALTRQLVELMRGHIGVRSREGEGTQFWVDLPSHEQPLEAVEALDGKSALALIVDDDERSRELLCLSLQEAGFRTIAVASGDEAVAQARRHHPEVITLDVFLPTIDGWDVLRLLKSDPATAEIPVVMVSISGDRGKAFSLGAVEHLVKPVERDALWAALERRSFTTRVKTRPVNVLAIDDDQQQLDLFRAALEPHGFVVRAESSGKAGLLAAQKEQIDLVLLDLVMPDLSGIEVVAQLRADERTREVPILLVTGHELSSAQRTRLNGDIQAVVSKGAMRMEDLLTEIRRVLRRR
jgi:CheY-like chemotaxis protein